MNTDRVHIDTEEDGFHLLVKTEDGEWFDFKLTDPEALYDLVKAEIGPWLHERDQGRLAFLCVPDESVGLAYDRNAARAVFHDTQQEDFERPYLADDPKHPDFHSVHADLWDARDSARLAFLCVPDESGGLSEEQVRGKCDEMAANDPAVAAVWDSEAGYCRDDPKHPDFHSVHADLWDAREGK